MFEKMPVDFIIVLRGKCAMVGVGYFQRGKVIRIDAEGQKPGWIIIFVFNLQPDRLDALFIKWEAEYFFRLLGTQHGCRNPK